MPNIFAYIVLFGWPVVVYVLFRRLPPGPALGWSVLAGYLLLPTQAGLNLTLLPTIDKDSIPTLSAGLMLLLGVGAATEGRRRSRKGPPRRTQMDHGRPPGQWLVTTMVALLLISPLVTVLANPDPVETFTYVISGLGLYDAGAAIGGIAISILPFLLARRYFATPQSHAVLLKILVVGLLGYSLFILFEVRMSPQLNVMTYGFFPHEFQQHVRAGSYRPVVFLQHGLWLAIVVAMAIIAAAALWRQRLSEGARAGQWLFAAIYLLLVLVLCSSLGALAIVLLILPVVVLLGVRSQIVLAGIIAALVLIYPMLRVAQLVPVERVLEIASSVNEDRASSLEFRLVNEEALLERAALRPVAGWGMWGRMHTFDPETGISSSVADSAWIIAVGTYGWLGYLASFGLLTLPILLLAVRRRTLGLSPATAGLALVMAANLLDLLSNATLTPVTWLIGGALMGRYAYRAAAMDDPAMAISSPPAPRRNWGLVTDMSTVLADAAASAPQPIAARSGRRVQ